MTKQTILKIKKIYLAGKIDLMKAFRKYWHLEDKEKQEKIKLLEEDWDKFFENMFKSSI